MALHKNGTAEARHLRCHAALWTWALIPGLFFSAEAVRAGTAFLKYDFEDERLDGFFIPRAIEFCGALLACGPVTAAGGEVKMTNSQIFGISIFTLLPGVVGEKFPQSRDYKLRVRIRFGEVREFVVGVRSRAGVNEAANVLHSDVELGYSISVIPGGFVPGFTNGGIALAELTACHVLVWHEEWPGAEGNQAFARVGTDFAISPDQWYWLDVIVQGNDLGGPVSLSVTLWPDGGEPPDKPQIAVVDLNGLDHRADTLNPAVETQVTFGTDLDVSETERRGNISMFLDDLSLFELPRFRRGDVDGSGATNISDAVFTLSYLFLGGVALGCPDAADVDDNGEINISDPVALLSFLFLGAEPLALPGPDDCGLDPTEDRLEECGSQERCQ